MTVRESSRRLAQWCKRDQTALRAKCHERNAAGTAAAQRQAAQQPLAAPDCARQATKTRSERCT